MFGQDDNQTVMSSPTVQNPSGAAAQPAPAQNDASAPPPQSNVFSDTSALGSTPTDTTDPSQQAAPSDNLFSQNPAVISPSGPVNPPLTQLADTPDDQSDYLAALTNDSSTPPVDLDKLADMKQQALQHLEPLADHLDGTPEETFKATMMMIQANDNHTLLEKALEAAKKIEDDKTRAQAMLDIINEINYFSQQNQ